MTESRFEDLLSELLDENPFAIRPFLKVAGIRFTDSVPTMAVTCAQAPELLVNVAFVEKECATDAEVKAVLLHEFLHVLLRHTGKSGPVAPEEHLATDAVINAIIHRQLGTEYSAMMSRYYADSKGLMRLLRPPSPGELPPINGGVAPFEQTWRALYEGKLIVDDIRELAEAMAGTRKDGGVSIDLEMLLGNHEGLPGKLAEALADILNKALRTMNGGGIWRSPREHGVGTLAYEALVTGSSLAMRAWERRALAVLRKHLVDDKTSRALVAMPVDSQMPVLSPHDRRAFAHALWSPLLPMASWELTAERPAGTAQVYLDVSGSMDGEMPLVIALLNRLRRSIRMPFWAFSTDVKPARIVKGQLKTETTGGTSLSCVLIHIAKTSPEAAVIVTDGYVERIPENLVTSTAPARIHALVTRGGSTKELESAHIPYTQLQEVPR